MNSNKILKTYTITILFGLLFLVELIANQLTHSLVILSDCYYNLFTFMTMVLFLMSNRMSNSVSLRATFGWARIEVLGALFNIIFILAMCFSVFVEGILNLIHSSHHESQPTNPLYLLVPGIVSFTLNFWRCIFFNEPSRAKNIQLSIQGEEVQVNCVVSGDFVPVPKKNVKTCGLTEADEKEEDELDKLLVNSSSNYTSEDTLSQKENFVLKIIKAIGTSLLLIGASSSLYYGDGELASIIDSITGLLGIFIILSVIYPSMKESGLILLQTVPKHIEVAQVKEALCREFPSIIEIHDFHVWCLTRDKIIATCHISLPALSSHSYNNLSTQISKFLAREGITLATVQPEFPNGSPTNGKCLYICSKNREECSDKQCCHEAGHEDDDGETDTCHNRDHSKV